VEQIEIKSGDDREAFLFFQRIILRRPLIGFLAVVLSAQQSSILCRERPEIPRRQGMIQRPFPLILNVSEVFAAFKAPILEAVKNFLCLDMDSAG